MLLIGMFIDSFQRFGTVATKGKNALVYFTFSITNIYSSSLTIPPCTENTQWRIFDVPLKISKDQSARMSNLLVSQLDDSCNRASIAYNRTVSRPIQAKKQSVFCCESDDFKADVRDHDYWESLWPEKYHGRKGLK